MRSALAALLLLSFAVANPSADMSAQTTSSAPAASTARYLTINAPFAQQLILNAKATHPELKKIGFHAMAPGETESAIIANATPSKIGKVSSAKDLIVVSSGQAKVYPHAEEGGFFDLGLPMFDAQRRPIGMVVMEIPYKDAATQDEAYSMAMRIRDEIAAKIRDKAALFQPAT